MKEAGARCQEWLPRKNRRCAAAALSLLPYCGNHRPLDVGTRIPCPVDPSHTILQAEAEAHVRRCPGLVRIQHMEGMSYYRKGVNAGSDDECEDGLHYTACDTVKDKEEDHVTSRSKRLMFMSLSRKELKALVEKIELAYDLHCRDKFELTMKFPAACAKWVSGDMDRRIPFQEKHVLQQASMLGNMESFGLLQPHESCDNGNQNSSATSSSYPVFVEFGAGRGYLAHMLADCYKANKIVLIERRSYKFKADRTLREYDTVALDRVRIDIENLDLEGVEPLQGRRYIALSKHLCGHATDLTLRCCGPDATTERSARHLDGIAIATCCHHICQWKPYINKKFFKQMGFTRKEFLILTWLTSGAVSGNKKSSNDEGSQMIGDSRGSSALISLAEAENIEEEYTDDRGQDAIGWLACFSDRAELGLKCKRLLDVGRLYWLEQIGMNANLVAYVSPEITPENTLLLASRRMKNTT